MDGIDCAGFIFYNQFDSANLAKVVRIPPNESALTGGKVAIEIPDAEFNIWTKPDCGGTEFENGNRTWFYFGIKSPAPNLTIRLNIVDLNRQGKMYSQGMAPVYRIIPGKPHWERIRDKPIHKTIDDVFMLSFKFKTPENVQSIVYFAFTYPFSYVDLQKMLSNIDEKFQNGATSPDDIYYTKEVVCRSLGGRDVNLITVTSRHGITPEMETRLKNLFPDKNTPRPFKFHGKKMIFISARVHPGETPSTFVFNGLLNLLLTRDDPIAIILRRLYVFKMIPFLNPDGVALGHYRTDTRGVNLNRVYLKPSLVQHPSVYAARALVRYYHYGYEKDEDVNDDDDDEKCVQCLDKDGMPNTISMKVSHMSLEEKKKKKSLWCIQCKNHSSHIVDGDLIAEISKTDNVTMLNIEQSLYLGNLCRQCKSADIDKNETESPAHVEPLNEPQQESGLFLYIDMHGHASKKGIFMYGNHFQDLDRNMECMLLPKLMSLNNHNFHFTACNFTERNMYLKDRRDGMSREGSGRVAVLKLTGLIKSYTLECNYNTGRIVNVLPPTVKESHSKVHTLLVPPKYNPEVFEEVGRSLGASILDLTGDNPCTRLPNSEFHSMSGLRDWLRFNCGNTADVNETRSATIPTKIKLKNIAALHNHQGKTAHGILMKGRPPSVKTVCKRLGGGNAKMRPATVPIDKKENMVVVVQPVNNLVPTISNQPTTIDNNNKKRLNKNLKTKKNCGGGGGGGGDKQKSTIRSKLKTSSALGGPKGRLDSTKLLHRKLPNKGKVDKSEKLREIPYKTAAAYVIKEAVDDLGLPWKPSSCSATSQQVFASQFVEERSVVSSSAVADLMNCDDGEVAAGSSKQQGIYRVHNFAKNSKPKFKKHTLRRLTHNAGGSLVDAGKVEKVKRRKKLGSK